MKLGFVSAILPDLNLSQVLEVAAQTGYSTVELMCWPSGKAERRYAGVTHIDVTDDAEVKRSGQLLHKSGISASGLGYYPNPLSANEHEAETAITHLKKVISAAQHLGLKVVNTFIGRDCTRSIKDNWKLVEERWPAVIKHAENCGVLIAIEHCPMRYTDDEWPGGKNLPASPKLWRELFDRLPSRNLGLNYDPSHLIWQLIDPAKPIREFATTSASIRRFQAGRDTRFAGNACTLFPSRTPRPPPSRR